VALVNRSATFLTGLYGLFVGGAGETYCQADAHKQQERQRADEVVHGVGWCSLLCNPSNGSGQPRAARAWIVAVLKVSSLA
jgi:hypothetical protein